MIAKSNLTALLITILFSISGYSEIKNVYQQILEDYDIHPPALKYGYPLWYEYDTVQPTAIIFLKKELDDLHKISKITYVAEPTKENAEIIFNFSADIPVYSWGTYHNLIPKFYIIPDSNLTWREIEDFLKHLTFDYSSSLFLLCSSNQRYINFKLSEDSYPDNYMPVGCCGLRDLLVIMNNCRGEILAENDFVEFDSIYKIVYEYYWGNYTDGFVHNSIFRSTIGLKESEVLINNLKDVIEKIDSSDISLLKFLQGDLNMMTNRHEMISKRGNLSYPSNNASMHIKFQFCGRLVQDYYKYLDQINKGVYLSRKTKAADFSELSYYEMFHYRKFDDLQYIHFEFPDILVNHFYRDGSDYLRRMAIPLPPFEEIIIYDDVEIEALKPDTLKSELPNVE